MNILRSADLADVAAEILPIVGYSSVLVRSDNSWHAVSRVVNPAVPFAAQHDRDILQARFGELDVASWRTRRRCTGTKQRI